MRLLRSLLRKLAALGLLVVFPVLGWYLLIVPTMEQYQRNAEALADRANLFVRYTSVADQAAIVQAAVRETAPVDSDEAFAGDSEAMIRATLQTTVQSLVSRGGASFLSAQAAPAKTTGTIRYVGLQLVLTGEIGAIAQTIHNIEANRPYLFIDRIELRRQGLAADNEAYVPAVLDVTMDVYAVDASPDPKAAP